MMGGKELAKVLIYYQLIPEVSSYHFSIRCPFHDDRNPSMSVDLETGKFFCFGCEAIGDAFDFVRRAEPELTELQACIHLSKILKSKEFANMSFKVSKKRQRNNKQLAIEAKDYYYGLSKTDWKNVDSEEEWILEYMENRGFNAQTLNRCGAKINYNKVYPIIFPMLDNGKFKGWVCRTTNKRVEKNLAKYLYNDGFHKRTTVVGDYEGKKIIAVTEGYMDRLKMVQYGVNDVVALLGWHISDEQINKLKESGVELVISALDNDECGEKGTELLKKYFPVVRFQYPNGVKDPGEMDRKTFLKCYNETKTEVEKWKRLELRNQKKQIKTIHMK